MDTTTIYQVEIGSKHLPIFKSLFKQYKIKSKIVKKEDDTEMTKQEFIDKINKASSGKKIEMSFDELKRVMLE